MAKLVIYEEIEGAETIFEDFQLSAHRILIGSSEDNNLVLDIPDIDPTHASLEFRNDHWVIQD
ncbi:MAG: FHA domain-containing protein, partial [Anaerolineae bacterium]|nr:FHA domain-containing protein [Anaerolineae bacterium]